MVAAISLVPASAAELPGPWVEFAADGALSVRAIVAAGQACPAATADGQSVAMQPRMAPDRGFNLTVCEAHVAPGAAAIAVAGAPVPRLAPELRRIVIIGDTGCRLEGKAIQDCNDPAGWPFPALAQRAASKKPDLVIHVGDYYYRESACPAGRTGCAGSPFGDNWPVWDAEFFAPAAPLLAAAPWVMVRGNHEVCRRGGKGWVRLIDPLPPAACTDHTAPYRVAANGLDLLVFDSADADDFTAAPEKVAAYGEQFAALLANPPPHAWLVTHRPVWAPAGGKLTGLALNQTLEAAVRGHIPPSIDMVLSGHLHFLANYTFGPERPPQLIVGTTGDALLDLPTVSAVGAQLDGMTVTKAYGLKTFGYLVLDRVEGGWDGAFYGPEDAVLAHCALRGRDVECR